MALRIRFQYPSGASLGYSVERLADGAIFDFADSAFRSQPNTPIADLPEDSGVFVGRYRVNLTPTPVSVFTDGDYLVTVHNKNTSNLVVAQLTCVMRSGDDATPTVAPAAAAIDPWNVPLPGSYAAGTAGAIVGQRLDAAVSSRSTFSGGTVQAVASPVAVGSILDKTGFVLASNGLDVVQVENGINARQALSPILAASAGSMSGAGTGSIVIKAAGGVATRITATTDNAGNRSSIDLNLPA